MSGRVVVLLSLVFCLCVLATGCSLNYMNSPSSVTNPQLPTLNLAGKVRGGQQPVSGATIQLYVANTTSNQGASTPMITSTVTTASDGTFKITSDYTCPTSNPLVYIVSTGGNPGLGGTVNNTDMTLMSLLGPCNSLSSNTVIIINELSTVASVQALSSFMSDALHVGSAPSNLVGIAGAFATASYTYDFSTGQFPGGGLDLGVPELQLNTLANILAACVNTSGGVSGDGSPCGKLLSLAGGTDTVTAALHMVQSPGNNTAQLYALIVATPPFQPYFSSVPTDFSSAVGYTFPANIQAGTLDSNGNIWLSTDGYSYNTMTDQSTDTQGAIYVYNNNFVEQFSLTSPDGGFNYPSGMAPDASGNVYTINANNTVSEFSAAPAAISPAAGWPSGFTSTFTGIGTGNGYVTDASEAGPISVDALGNMWIGAPSVATTACYAELNKSGTNITPAGISSFCASIGNEFSSFATDGSGNAWALGYMAIAKVNASGTLAATAPTSQSCFEPATNIVLGGLNFDMETVGLQYDHVHNQLWGFSGTGAGAITNAGTAVFCDAASPSMPFITSYASTSTTPGDPYSAGSLLITSAALDGAGNLWFLTNGVAATGTVGTLTGTFNGTVTYSTWLGELSPTGALLTPYNAGTGVYGLQPAGLGTNVTATSTGGSIGNESASASLLGVDRSGNIWAFDFQSNKLLKITGLATANTVNY